jgi:hypothetical protein
MFELKVISTIFGFALDPRFASYIFWALMFGHFRFENNAFAVGRWLSHLFFLLLLAFNYLFSF